MSGLIPKSNNGGDVSNQHARRTTPTNPAPKESCTILAARPQAFTRALRRLYCGDWEYRGTATFYNGRIRRLGAKSHKVCIAATMISPTSLIQQQNAWHKSSVAAGSDPFCCLHAVHHVLFTEKEGIPSMLPSSCFRLARRVNFLWCSYAFQNFFLFCSISYYC